MRYFLTIIFLTNLLILFGCNFQSDNAPVELHLSEQFNEYTSSDYLQLDVNAVADKVEIYEVIVNRGNTCQPRFWYRNWKGHGILKFGQGARAHITCDFHTVKEITVNTDQGSYTFDF